MITRKRICSGYYRVFSAGRMFIIESLAQNGSNPQPGWALREKGRGGHVYVLRDVFRTMRAAMDEIRKLTGDQVR